MCSFMNFAMLSEHFTRRILPRPTSLLGEDYQLLALKDDAIFIPSAEHNVTEAIYYLTTKSSLLSYIFSQPSRSKTKFCYREAAWDSG